MIRDRQGERGAPAAARIAAHAWAGLALISLAGGFIASTHLPGISNYAILGLGTIVVGLVPDRWRRTGLLGRDGFASVLGVALIGNGCYMVFVPGQFAAPIFDLVRPYLPLFGPGLIAGGLALLAAQLVPSVPRALLWAAYLLPATLLLAYLMRGPLPYGSWTGTAYYGGFGVVLALLPWLGPRLRRLDPSSLRLQLALALIVAGALPLVGAVAFIADLQERSVVERELELQKNQAAILADDLSRSITRHESSVSTLAKIPRLAGLSPTSKVTIVRSASRAQDGELTFAIFGPNDQPIAATQTDGDPFDPSSSGMAVSGPATLGVAPKIEVIRPAPDEPPVLLARAAIEGANGEYAGQLVGVLNRQRLIDRLASASAVTGARDDGEHRRGAEHAGARPPGASAQRRGRGALSGEGAGEGPPRRLRHEHGRPGAGAAGARDRSQTRCQARRAARPLSADRGPGDRAGL
ncbi:MAG TPA: hypothetical protein VFH48_29465 [Chloroflexota bacterium]|nr:hypothetical protein [Chloroflexota bacterium]